MLAKCGKPFTDGGIVKNRLLEVAEELCPEKSKLFQNLPFGANTVACRIANMGENMIGQIVSYTSKFRHFSLAMDEPFDMCDTPQLLIFIRGVNEDLIVTQELASMNGMYNIVTGEDLFNELKKIFDYYHLNWSRLHFLTINGGKNMCGIKKGFFG